MPIVNSSVVIDGPIHKVFALARDIETFPEFMNDLESVRIIECNEDRTRVVSEWTGIVKEFKTKIRWTEEDIWNETDKTCEFRLIKGDYSKYSGKWNFTDEDGQTRFDSEIEVEYDVPLIGALIKSIIAKKMKENVDNMLAAVKAKVESA